jgi:hypothetical protein
MMTNKELIGMLTGFSMKSEVEVIFDGKPVAIEKVTRVYIPEGPEPKGAPGKKTPARNIVQIILKQSE